MPGVVVSFREDGKGLRKLIVPQNADMLRQTVEHNAGFARSAPQTNHNYNMVIVFAIVAITCASLRQVNKIAPMRSSSRL